jgi:hypothetical protein
MLSRDELLPAYLRTYAPTVDSTMRPAAARNLHLPVSRDLSPQTYRQSLLDAKMPASYRLYSFRTSILG